MSQPEDVTYTSIPSQYGRLISTHIPAPVCLWHNFCNRHADRNASTGESSRDDVAFAGSGVALEIMGYGKDRFETIRHNAIELFADAIVLDEQEALAAPRLFGGFSFRNDFVPDVAWSDFSSGAFCLTSLSTGADRRCHLAGD